MDAMDASASEFKELRFSGRGLRSPAGLDPRFAMDGVSFSASKHLKGEFGELSIDSRSSDILLRKDFCFIKAAMSRRARIKPSACYAGTPGAASSTEKCRSAKASAPGAL
mmetsp:Transcript_3862/g.5464  ORF Transcript_3862/g.5464 Transcript_3862/m.5464 type:complete len:110 (+) Transcript_3862:76-405(+)